MKSAKELYDLLRNLHNDGVDNIFPATVVSVDKINSVCVVKIDDLQIEDVRLRSTINENGKGFVIYPKEDSVVLVERIAEGTFFICMYSEVEELNLSIETVEMAVNADGYLIKKGNDTLKEAMVLLIEAVQAIIVMQGRNPDRLKLQQALDKVNNILN